MNRRIATALILVLSACSGADDDAPAPFRLEEPAALKMGLGESGKTDLVVTGVTQPLAFVAERCFRTDGESTPLMPEDIAFGASENRGGKWVTSLQVRPTRLGQIGSHLCEISGRNEQGYEASTQIGINIANHRPELAATPGLLVRAGETLDFTLPVTDRDQEFGDAITDCRIANGSAGCENGRLHWKLPANAASAEHHLEVSVRDHHEWSKTASVQVVVLARPDLTTEVTLGNSALPIDPIRFREGETLEIRLSPATPGASLACTLPGNAACPDLSAELHFFSDHGVVSWQASARSSGGPYFLSVGGHKPIPVIIEENKNERPRIVSVAGQPQPRTPPTVAESSSDELEVPVVLEDPEQEGGLVLLPPTCTPAAAVRAVMDDATHGRLLWSVSDSARHHCTLVALDIRMAKSEPVEVVLVGRPRTNRAPALTTTIRELDAIPNQEVRLTFQATDERPDTLRFQSECRAPDGSRTTGTWSNTGPNWSWLAPRQEGSFECWFTATDNENSSSAKVTVRIRVKAPAVLDPAAVVRSFVESAQAQGPEGRKTVAVLLKVAGTNNLPEAARKLALLKTLNLHMAAIRELGPIATLVQLEHLDIGQTAVRDLEPLRSLTRLRALNLRDLDVTSLGILSALKELRHLSLDGVRLNGAPLQNLNTLSAPNLETLYASRNGIARLDTLASHPALRYLNLSANQLTDLRPLTRLTGLQELHLSRNRISDLTPLGELPSLELVNASDNPAIRTLPLFERLENLRTLQLNGTAIQDFSPLAEARRRGTAQYALRNLKSIEAYSSAKFVNTAVLRKLYWVERFRVNPASLPGGECPLEMAYQCDFRAPARP